MGRAKLASFILTSQGVVSVPHSWRQWEHLPAF